jgi:galactokinase
MQHARQDHPSLNQLADRASLRFEQRFGRTPGVVVAAPGRVNLIGEHTDYNGGYVLPMSIDRYVVMAGDRSPGGASEKRIRCCSGAFEDMASFDVTAEPGPDDPKWSNFVRGVAACMLKIGLDVPGFDCAIESDLPLGGGLASSAALEVATATLIEALLGQCLNPLQKARLCQRAEHEFVGMPCGVMDQIASAMGSSTDALLIDCEREQVRYIPLSDEVSVLVMNSNVRHMLAGSPYADRRSTCHRAAEKSGASSLRHVTLRQLEANRDRLDALEYRRARHVITENERTLAAAEAISRRQWVAAGELMYASHASMRDDFEISCPEIDALVDAARRIGASGGVFGARLTGGGFGGSTVTLVQADKAVPIAEKLVEEYQCQFGGAPDWFVPRPAAGAQVLSDWSAGRERLVDSIARTI